jgi:hypothetical protein
MRKIIPWKDILTAGIFTTRVSAGPLDVTAVPSWTPSGPNFGIALRGRRRADCQVRDDFARGGE